MTHNITLMVFPVLTIGLMNIVNKTLYISKFLFSPLLSFMKNTNRDDLKVKILICHKTEDEGVT